jgi:hypothetical protein
MSEIARVKYLGVTDMFELGMKLDGWPPSISMYNKDSLGEDTPKIGFSSWAMAAYSEFFVEAMTTKPCLVSRLSRSVNSFHAQ